MDKIKKCIYFDTLNAENVSVPQSSPLCPATKQFLTSTNRVFVLTVYLCIIGLVLVLIALILAIFIFQGKDPKSKQVHNLAITQIAFASLFVFFLIGELVWSSPRFLQKPYLQSADS